MLTAMAGAVINVVLNFVLIPSHGAMGAAVATLISYLATYVIRAYDTGHYVKFKQSSFRVVLNFGLLLFQSMVMLTEIRYWKYLTVAVFLVVILVNGKEVVTGMLRLFKIFFAKKKKKF